MMVLYLLVIQTGSGGWEPDRISPNSDGYYNIPAKYRPELKKMRIEVDNIKHTMAYTHQPARCLAGG